MPGGEDGGDAAGGAEETWGADAWGTPGDGDPVAVGRARLPTGRSSSFSRSFPRAIQTLSRSIEERTAPGSTSSFSRNAFGCFIPSAHKIARRAAGLEETIVPTRMKLVRAAWGAEPALAVGRRDGNFIPCAGANGLFHSSGGAVGTAFSAGSAADRAATSGEYASRPRYLVSIVPREPAATTTDIPKIARYAGVRIRSPEKKM